jgi:hypothetical protein
MKINSCLITYPLVLILEVSKYCTLKFLIVQCTLSLVIMTAYVMFEKKPHTKNDWIVNIEKKSVFFYCWQPSGMSLATEATW